MEKTPIFITVRSDGVTEISGYPDGFPVDGDALHSRAAVRKRAEALIMADPTVLATARTWLGGPLDPNDAELPPAEVARLVSQLHPGGAGRFIAVEPTLRKAVPA
ncbi:hypothetical protein [Pseudarthrobacter chlorophenolicus]|nr:hypothetical protein [Pseudarthrobacter chlorophenolicus]